jgi:hypothetical protein
MAENTILHDLVAPPGGTARYCRERIQTARESAIRPRFVRDSFHSLDTAIFGHFAQVCPCRTMVLREGYGTARGPQGRAMGWVDPQAMRSSGAMSSMSLGSMSLSSISLGSMGLRPISPQRQCAPGWPKPNFRRFAGCEERLDWCRASGYGDGRPSRVEHPNNSSGSD